MKQYVKILISGLVIACFSGIAGAQDLKIVYVDSQKLFNESIAGKNAVNTIEKFGKEKQALIDEKQAAIKKLGEEISAKSLTMTQEAKDKKEAEYQKNIKDLNRFIKDAQDELQEKQNALLKPVRQDLDEIIAEYGKKNNIDLILDVRVAGVVYKSERGDVTSEILKIYDEKHQSKNKDGKSQEKTKKGSK